MELWLFWGLIALGVFYLGTVIWVIWSHLKRHHPPPDTPAPFINIPDGEAVHAILLNQDGSVYGTRSFIKFRPRALVKYHGKRPAEIFHDSNEIDSSGRLIYRRSK